MRQTSFCIDYVPNFAMPKNISTLLPQSALGIDKFVERGNAEVAFHLADMKIQSGGLGYSKLFRDVLIYPGCYKASTLAETRKTDPKEENPVLGPKAVLRHVSVWYRKTLFLTLVPLILHFQGYGAINLYYTVRWWKKNTGLVELLPCTMPALIKIQTI